MHTLDSTTTAQLSAGSTINRPAAVIRELIDNAIDAHATVISIYLDGQGRMRVQDNGTGMCSEDLTMAFQSHTTSKITRYEDLGTLTTLGFRGDALASIAAIARVTCISRTSACNTAHELRIAGGVVHDIRPCAGTIGTDITVERLYNTIPHRRSFWRQPHTERQYIVDVCTQYALIYTEISFGVFYEQTTLLHTPGTHDLHQTMLAIWPQIEPTYVHAQMHDNAIQVHGYIAPTTAAARRLQIVAINRRPVLVRGFLAHLIDEVVPPIRNRHPTVVLHFTLPSDEIDVNFRNNKDELGLRSPSMVARLLHAAIRTPPSQPVLFQADTPMLPTLTYIGRHNDWHVWSGVEGLVVINPANVMQACHITTLERGALCVPPYPLNHHTATIFHAHTEQWRTLGIQLEYDRDSRLCLTRLPLHATHEALDIALAACIRTIRHGGTFAMGIGHLLNPIWLYEQLHTIRNPWDYHAVWMIGNHRLADTLRITTASTEVPGQSP